MQVHLIDGTYELFRHYYAVPRRTDADGNEVGAIRGVLSSMLALLREGSTHLAVATDHVIESFRNQMWPGYKRGGSIEPELLAQFHPLEHALVAMGVTVWRMERFEADDAIASAVAALVKNPAVERIIVCTPDKDLAQCVVGERVVQLDRRARVVRDAVAVREKFGVAPASIPDYLALVGDSADGYPGVRGWGAKSSSKVLGHYAYLEAIPGNAGEWQVQVRGAARLAAALTEQWEQALLFRDLATLRTDAIELADVEALRWRGPSEHFGALCDQIGAPGLAEQARQIQRQRQPE